MPPSTSLIDRIIGRHRAVLLLLCLLIIAGFSAYLSIPKERSPDVQIPFIYVSVVHQGISPEDAERLIIKPLEKEMKSIDGVKEMTAYAVEGRASVTLEFSPGFDSQKALLDVREKVDIAGSFLPEDAEEPVINEINLSKFPIVNVILMGDMPERSLLTIAKRLQDEIEAIPEVLSVNLAGDREDVVEVIIDPMLMEGYQFSIADVFSVFDRNNILIASGALNDEIGRYNIKVPGLLEGIKDIDNVPLKVNRNAVVTAADVTNVRRTYRDATGYARVNGSSAMVLEVSKRPGENIIDTINNIKQTVKEAALLFPPNLQYAFAQDESQAIFDILTDLQNNIIFAILLVMIIIILYIGIKSSLLISIAIPGSFLIGILVLSFLDMTLNIVVLFSLILSVGMLVDSAIVVCEYASRMMQEGYSRKKSYAIASRRMVWPIIASTVTTVIVFLPLLFWPGIVGQFMKYMPITIIATLSGSLLMALVFIPTIGAVFGKKEQTDQVIQQDHSDGEIHPFTEKYVRALKFILQHPGKFALTILAAMIGVIILYGKIGKGAEFFPAIEPENAKVNVYARGNLSIDEKDAMVQQVEAKILEHFSDEIAIVYARSGGTGDNRGNQAEDLIGSIFVEFQNWRIRRKASVILDEIKYYTQDIPGILIRTEESEQGPGQNKPIFIQVASYAPELLEPYVSKIVAAMESIDGFKDIEDTRPIPAIEWNIAIDRATAARFGTDTLTVGNTIKLVTNGLKASTYRPNDTDDEVDVLVRYPEDKRGLTALDNIRVTTANGDLVPISSFVERIAKPQLSSVLRADGYRVMNITSNIEEDVLAQDLLQSLQEKMKDIERDSRLFVQFKGDDEDQKETGAFLQNAFLLALFVMALILVTQFNSIYHMLIILSAVFLSTTGVLLGLLITNQAFGVVMCGVGIIALSGIVVNNNIIYIDTFRQLKNEGLSVTEAIVGTGMQRIRPILLTSVTTILGLIPMVTGMNINFITREVTFGAPSTQWWTQLSTSIAGGLAFATVLTLFFTPALLALVHRREAKK